MAKLCDCMSHALVASHWFAMAVDLADFEHGGPKPIWYAKIEKSLDERHESPERKEKWREGMTAKAKLDQVRTKVQALQRECGVSPVMSWPGPRKGQRLEDIITELETANKWPDDMLTIDALLGANLWGCKE